MSAAFTGKYCKDQRSFVRRPPSGGPGFAKDLNGSQGPSTISFGGKSRIFAVDPRKLERGDITFGQSAALALASEAIGRADQYLMPVEFLRTFTKVRISVFQAGRHVIGDHSLDPATNHPSVPIVG